MFCLLGAVGGGVAVWSWSALGVGTAAAAGLVSLIATGTVLVGGPGPAGRLALGLAWWWIGTALSIPFAALGLLIGSLAGTGDRAVAMIVAHGVGLGLAAWGVFVERWWMKSPRLVLEIPGLASDLDGYRIVHLSDLHISRFTPERRILEWARRVHDLAPDLIAITGDLSAKRGYRTRAVAEALARLSAPDGVLVSFGNHERGHADEVARTLAELAPEIRLLRSSWHEIRRGGARLLLFGMDDWQRDPAHVARAVASRPSAAPVVLLAHSLELAREVLARAPELAPVLVLMGHTHGGQIGVPGLGRWLNLTLLTGQRARGLARRHGRWEFVNVGLGTSGPPLRLGVRPELPTLVLRAGPGTMP